MKLCIISFTEKGKQLSEKMAEELEEMEIALFTKQRAGSKMQRGQNKTRVSYVEESVMEWAGKQMRQRNPMVFIGACGIAVRAIAPHLTDKLKDSPVLVMEEKGRFVIPILSGHVGGANALAVYLAEKMGAEPVITTATDQNGKFAVDLFAKENGLYIVNKDGIARVSSKVLAGEKIAMSIETKLLASVFSENTFQKIESVYLVPYPPEGPVDVLIASKEDGFEASLFLRPKEYVIGMGCKRGKEAEVIEAFISKKIEELHISAIQILALASVSQKKDEQGLSAWCQKQGAAFLTYTPEELQKVEGNFKSSSFVKAEIGVDNVCERAAIKACGPAGGELIGEKYAENGMTIAVAKRTV